MTCISKKIIVFLLTVVFLFCCSSCSVTDNSVLSFSVKNTKSTIGSGTESLHTLSTLPEKTVTTSGLTALLFDSATASVCVAELTKGNIWSVLPMFSNGSAATFDVVLRTPEGTYYLNSQDNSVAFGSYNYTVTENGVDLEFLIADKKENTSTSVSSVNEGVAAKITVRYTLTDGDLRVSVDCGKIELSPNTVLESISLMPYFGAVNSSAESENHSIKEAVLSSAQRIAGVSDSILPSDFSEQTTAESGTSESKKNENDNPENGTDKNNAENDTIDAKSRDFLLVPDGCGAVMYTDIEDENTSEVAFDVYGNGENSAKIPVFGIKKGSGAFSAIIGDGAAVAKIKARRAEKDPFGAATVYPIFTVTRSSSTGGRYNYMAPYVGKISVCYRFMSGSEANYISMASVCREELIRFGVLSSRTVLNDDYPLNLAVTVSVDGSSKRTVSTFEEAEDLLQLLKAKGIENVSVLLNGAFNGGLAGDGSTTLTPLRKAGGSSGLQKLFGYAEKQKFKLYAGVNLIKTSSQKNSGVARDVDGNTIRSTVKNPLAPKIGQSDYSVYLASADRIENNTIELMNSVEKLPVSGLCILDGDIGSYADSTSNKDRETVAGIIKNNVSSFATRKELAISQGSLNTVKNASLLVDAPLRSFYKENDAYRAVPLIPAVLHSTVHYSGNPANSGTTTQLELLKCVEYGAYPYYLWDFDEMSHYYYEQTFSDAVSFSLRATEELGTLSRCRIVSHSEIEKNVYCTGYDNGSLVYVNYNNFSVNIGDISVLPYDYIRIN